MEIFKIHKKYIDNTVLYASMIFTAVVISSSIIDPNQTIIIPLVLLTYYVTAAAYAYNLNETQRQYLLGNRSKASGHFLISLLLCFIALCSNIAPLYSFGSFTEAFWFTSTGMACFMTKLFDGFDTKPLIHNKRRRYKRNLKIVN